MATIHIPEAEAARNFEALMAHVRAGAEVVIEDDSRAVAFVTPAASRSDPSKPGLLLSEMIERAKARGSTATLDGSFGRDLEDAVNSHPEPLNVPEWD